jgi:hypothetical protein
MLNVKPSGFNLIYSSVGKSRSELALLLKQVEVSKVTILSKNDEEDVVGLIEPFDLTYQVLHPVTPIILYMFIISYPVRSPDAYAAGKQRSHLHRASTATTDHVPRAAEHGCQLQRHCAAGGCLHAMDGPTAGSVLCAAFEGARAERTPFKSYLLPLAT